MPRMTILRAHRILIWTFLVFAIVFGVIQLREWRRTGRTGSGVSAVVAAVIVVAARQYLRRLGRDPSGD